MTERALPWHPVPDITDGFYSISAICQSRALDSQSKRLATLTLYSRPTSHDRRDLHLSFESVVAIYLEDDCPGTFVLPRDCPRVNAEFVFPLLVIEGSKWLANWPMWPNHVHYALLSLDDLVHVVASPGATGRWSDESAA